MTADQQAASGFEVAFEWDVDLTDGYEHSFLHNAAAHPGTDHFWSADTPEVGERLRDGKFDVVLTTGWYLKCFWQIIWAAKRMGIPVMVRGDSHLETPRSPLTRLGKELFYPIALRAFDVALYVGEQSRSYWRHYGFAANRLVFSPHCVDNAWFAARVSCEGRRKLRAAHGISETAMVALFAGKLLPFKRPLDLIAAAEILALSGRNLTVLAAGSGPLREKMSASAEAAKVPLVSLGFCNQTEMPVAYAAADVLVLPSDGRETWGLVANEALACGIPIVISDACGCARDLAADNTAGRVFPVGDAASLAAALQEIIEQPPSAAAIAAKAARYSVAAAVDGIMSGMERAGRRS